MTVAKNEAPNLKSGVTPPLTVSRNNNDRAIQQKKSKKYDRERANDFTRRRRRRREVTEEEALSTFRLRCVLARGLATTDGRLARCVQSGASRFCHTTLLGSS